MEWYKRKMANPATTREEYMLCWNIVRELEQQAASTYHAGEARCAASLKNQEKLS